MLKKIFNKKRVGFTLIELLVVVAILGVLAAIVVPNVGKFIGKGQTEAGNTELHNVQTAVLAAMAEAKVGTVLNGATITSGGSNAGVNVGSYLVGGYTKLKGIYTLASDGSVSTSTYIP